MVTNKSKRDFFIDSYTLCLCWMQWFVSRLIYLSLTKPTMQQCFHPRAKHLLYRCITPSFVGHSFRIEGETSSFFANSPLCILFSNIFLCRYASRTLRIKLLTWCRVISLAGRFGSGRSRDLILSKYFGLISSLHTKPFITLRVTTFFFRDVDLLCSPR